MKAVGGLFGIVALAALAAACGNGSGGQAAPAAGSVTEMKTCQNGQSPVVFAVNRDSGDLQWTYCPGAPAIGDVIGATDKLVFAEVIRPPGEYALVALDANNGTERWRTEAAAAWTPGPIAGGGVIAVVLMPRGAGGTVADWEIAGIDAGTGNVKWKLAANKAIPLAQGEDVLVVAGRGDSNDRTVRGLDRSNGKERWRSNVVLDDRSGVGVSRSPAAVAGNVVVVPSGSEAVGINLETGLELWRSPQLNHPTGAGDVVIGGQETGPSAAVQAVDAADGRQLWNRPGRPSYGDIWALGDGAAYVLDQGVVAYDLRSGKEIWRRQDVPEPWAAGDGSVYTGWESIVIALSAKDGKTRWTLQPKLVAPSWMIGLVTNSRSAFIGVDNFAPTD